MYVINTVHFYPRSCGPKKAGKHLVTRWLTCKGQGVPSRTATFFYSHMYHQVNICTLNFLNYLILGFCLHQCMFRITFYLLLPLRSWAPKPPFLHTMVKKLQAPFITLFVTLTHSIHDSDCPPCKRGNHQHPI